MGFDYIMLSKSYNEGTIVADENFKVRFNLFYFLGVIVALLLPTLPATLTSINMLTQN